MDIRSLDADPLGAKLAGILAGPEIAKAARAVVFVHGITANAHTWPMVMARLPADTVGVGFDLRGRAASNGLGPPYGMATHADDIARRLDDLGIDRAVMVGHSMGAYVTSMFAHLHPERLEAAVLVDGGLPIGEPVQLDEGDGERERVLADLLGPALARLGHTFRTRDEALELWRIHPAFQRNWSDDVERYLDHDLGGVVPHLSSRAVREAVVADGGELMVDSFARHAVDQMACPVELLRVERGLLDEPNPLIPAHVAAAAANRNPMVRVTTVPGCNHYTIVLSPAGADAVAAAVRRAQARAEGA